MDLSEKQIAFCHEYLQDLNASKAAVRAGYSATSSRSTSSELMNNPAIKARIRTLLDQRNNDTFINTAFVIGNLISLANDALDGDPVLAWDKTEKCWKETGQTKTDRAAAIKALELLGKHIGLFDKEYMNFKKAAERPQMSREQLEELLQMIRDDAPPPKDLSLSVPIG